MAIFLVIKELQFTACIHPGDHTNDPARERRFHSAGCASLFRVLVARKVRCLRGKGWER